MSQNNTGFHQTYFVNVFMNLALVHEKKLQFKHSLDCLDKAVDYSSHENQKLDMLRDRMQKIVKALDNKVITLEQYPRQDKSNAAAPAHIQSEAKSSNKVDDHIFPSSNPNQSSAISKQSSTRYRLMQNRPIAGKSLRKRKYIDQVYSIRRSQKDYELLEARRGKLDMKGKR